VSCLCRSMQCRCHSCPTCLLYPSEDEQNYVTTLGCAKTQQQVCKVMRSVRGVGRSGTFSVAPGDILKRIDGKDVSGFPTSLLRHILAQKTESRVSLELLRPYADGRDLEYQVELARDSCELQERPAGHEMDALEIEALRMQILLLRDDTEHAWQRQRETATALSEAESALQAEREALGSTKMLLIASNEQVSRRCPASAS